MKPNDIRTWRPRLWTDYVGEANRRPVRRLQSAVKRREPPRALAFIAPYGAAKTSLARHLIASFCCENVSSTGDPCRMCWECMHQGREHNGMGYQLSHWELDCAQFAHRSEVRQTVQTIESEDDAAVFWDEFHRLRDGSAQPMLLKPSEDFHGIWIIAMTDDQYRQMDGQLFERFRKVWLATPTDSELVEFFIRRAPEWGVTASDGIIQLMVDRTQRSFRSCLDLLAAGAENDNRVLDRDTLEEFLTLGQPDDDSFPQLFGIADE